MFVMHTFTVEVKGKSLEGPVMGTGDINLLQELFPKNLLWKCRKSTLSNQMYPTIQEMKYLYDDLLRHFAEKDVSGREFQTGNFSGSFAIVSTERSIFQGIIGFCEKELGFKRPKKLRAAIAKKEAKYRREEEAQKKDRKGSTMAMFCKLPRLHKPKDSTLVARLGKKLQDYKSRLTRTFHHPDLAFSVEDGYRDTTYKIEVLSAVLALEKGKRLDLKKMVLKAMEKRGEHFFPDEYYNACAVIAHYLGTPFKGSDVRKELPQAAIA